MGLGMGIVLRHGCPSPEPHPPLLEHLAHVVRIALRRVYSGRGLGVYGHGQRVNVR